MHVHGHGVELLQARHGLEEEDHQTSALDGLDSSSQQIGCQRLQPHKGTNKHTTIDRHTAIINKNKIKTTLRWASTPATTRRNAQTHHNRQTDTQQ